MVHYVVLDEAPESQDAVSRKGSPSLLKRIFAHMGEGKDCRIDPLIPFIVD